jgi:3',5'-cyclic AMP phosphodiesterase CpdA
MRRIAHISGLHFGRIAPGVLGPLRECVRRLEPHLVVVSGDLTAGARAGQFRDARAFLDTLPGPQVVVPGASDVAQGSLFRMATALGPYRRFVSEDLEPEYADDTVAVIGVDATSPSNMNGTDEAARRARTRIHGLDARVVKIIAASRPILDGGADIVLTGIQGDDGERAATIPLVVQSGTISTGPSRAEVLSLHALHIEGSSLAVERWSWNGHTRRFEGQGRDTYGLPRS